MPKAWRRDPKIFSSWRYFHLLLPVDFHFPHLLLLLLFSSSSDLLRLPSGLLPFPSTTEWENKKDMKRMLITEQDKTKSYCSVSANTYTVMTQHGHSGCSLKLHPVMYNHYWRAASLWPAGSSPPRAFIYFFHPPPHLSEPREKEALSWM